MIYVIKGSEVCFIEDKIKEICADSDNVLKFDGNSKDFSVYDMLDACGANSLFAEKTIVVVKDPPFLIKKIDDKDLNAVMDYVNHPLYETDLILYSLEDKFNSKLKAYKQVIDNADLMSFDSFDYKSFNTYAASRIKKENLKISKDCMNLLITMCKRDATLFNKNLELLCLYPDDITIDVVNKLCTSSDDNISFDLINAITNKDISKAIVAERRLLSDNETIGIVNLLASQLRSLYAIAYMSSKGYKNSEICAEMNYTDYRLNLALETLKKLSMQRIIYMLSQLSRLDILYKSDNSISDVSRFELFILEMLKKEEYAGN